MTTLSQLKTFVAVVDHGGFTAASRRLGLSQPAVSRTVATLEKELGLPLFLRRRDGLSLTEAGAVAVTHAREAVRQLTLMHTGIAGLAGDVTGTLSLASLPSATATLVAPQLQKFARRHPAVTIRLLEGSANEILDWLDQGAAEAGVVGLPAKGLDVAVLGEQHMVAVVRPTAGWHPRNRHLRRPRQRAVRPWHRWLRGSFPADRAARRHRIRSGLRSA